MLRLGEIFTILIEKKRVCQKNVQKRGFSLMTPELAEMT